MQEMHLLNCNCDFAVDSVTSSWLIFPFLSPAPPSAARPGVRHRRSLRHRPVLRRLQAEQTGASGEGVAESGGKELFRSFLSFHCIFFPLVVQLRSPQGGRPRRTTEKERPCFSGITSIVMCWVLLF